MWNGIVTKILKRLKKFYNFYKFLQKFLKNYKEWEFTRKEDLLSKLWGKYQNTTNFFNVFRFVFYNIFIKMFNSFVFTDSIFNSQQC